MTARETKRRSVPTAVLAGLVGQGPVTSVIGLAPVVVANTRPNLMPTMRTLSFCGEIPMALTGTLAGLGDGLPVSWNFWLTGTMVTPLLLERNKVSEPK